MATAGNGNEVCQMVMELCVKWHRLEMTMKCVDWLRQVAMAGDGNGERQMVTAMECAKWPPLATAIQCVEW